ncbi:uncharacterized protein LOC131672866 isoform X2 [Phymastichus coffea]|uniref:uncharacterized protein LOC131672866 isoform X2 n=1 Tax=Phymastichus coffea TaxID=108790 RepID=UPI00273B80D8|nr:uncharacterized protein LOC131672866 isoform X2 [Phymastichus coffea]
MLRGRLVAALLLVAAQRACLGAPTPDGEPLPRLEPEAHPMDDLLPGDGESASSAAPGAALGPGAGPLVFADAPRHVDAEPGASVLLACRTAEPVLECRWSWQPLPPSQPAEDALTAPTTISAGGGSLPVRTFPAFGDAGNDCSVRFSSARYEQAGYWSCAARRRGDADFSSAAPARLGIAPVGSVAPIGFAEQPWAIETPAGAGARLPCRTLSPVRECQWSWRRLNQSQPWDAELRQFPADGDAPRSCDLALAAVRAEHEGLWTCGARLAAGAPFAQSSPVRLLLSEVEFVQLSRGIQTSAGETLLLRCLANKPVFECQWTWRPSNASANATLLRRFAPGRAAEHDCSARFRNVLRGEQGLWTCGVRLTPGGILHEAPPTSVGLLPSGRLSFTEAPESTAAALGGAATLRCATSARVERCAWAWRPLAGAPDARPTTLHEFPSHGELGRNCSLRLASLSREAQGYWTCRVFAPGQAAALAPAPAKLTVYERGEVGFSELSQDIQVSSGGTVGLRCVALARVEQCRWSLTPDASANTTVVVKQFAPAGPEARDCSVKLSHALREQEGLWTCGARLHARQNYTDAPPARLSLIEPEPISVTVWAVLHQMVNLACKTGLTAHETQCFWRHGEHLKLPEPARNLSGISRKIKYTISMNRSTGVCSLQFTPTDSKDFGEWICDFIVDDEHVTAELGSASILLIDNSPDQQLGWLVGAITSTVLFLLIIVVVVVVCKARLCTRKIPTFLETLPPAQVSHGNRVLGNQNASKIDLSYSNPNFLASPVNISSVLPNRSPHLYDKVGKREAPKTHENINKS